MSVAIELIKNAEYDVNYYSEKLKKSKEVLNYLLKTIEVIDPQIIKSDGK